MMTSVDRTNHPGSGANPVEAGRLLMGNDLGEAILEAIKQAKKGTTFREIERQVLAKSPEKDTYDVQRALRSLLEGGKVERAPGFQYVPRSDS